MTTITQDTRMGTASPAQVATGYTQPGSMGRRVILLIAWLIGPVFGLAISITAWVATAVYLGGSVVAFAIIGACYTGIGILVAALHYARQEHTLHQ